jgi:hypothetical protein
MRICYPRDLPADGTDVTAQLLALIAEHPDGTTFQFPDERYRLESSVAVSNRNGLTFEGGTFYATTQGELNAQGRSGRRHWFFTGGSEITVRGMRVESTNTVHPEWDNGGKEGFGGYLVAYEAEHGFAFHQVNGVLLEDFSTYGTWGDGVYVGNVQVPCTDVTIRRGTIAWNGRQGFAAASVDGLYISDVNVTNSRRSGFDLEPSVSGRFVNNVEIANCSTKTIGHPIAALGGGQVNNVFIHHLTTTTGLVIRCEAKDGARRSNWRIEECTAGLYGSPIAAMKFTRVDGVSIKANHMPIVKTQSRKCVTFDDCQGTLEVIDNNFSPGGCHVEALNGSSDPVVEGNVLVCP